MSCVCLSACYDQWHVDDEENLAVDNNMVECGHFFHWNSKPTIFVYSNRWSIFTGEAASSVYLFFSVSVLLFYSSDSRTNTILISLSEDFLPKNPRPLLSSPLFAWLIRSSNFCVPLVRFSQIWLVPRTDFWLPLNQLSKWLLRIKNFDFLPSGIVSFPVNVRL